MGFQKILEEVKRKSLESKDSIVLFVAILMAAVLLVAAIGKFLHPSKYLKVLDQWISFFEILLLGSILFFRKRPHLWTSVALLFATWAGYALFWYCVRLPCGCMGTKLNIPTAFTLGLDILFVLLSLLMASLLGLKRAALFLCVLFCLVFSLGGFAMGKWLFKSYVLRV